MPATFVFGGFAARAAGVAAPNMPRQRANKVVRRRERRKRLLIACPPGSGASSLYPFGGVVRRDRERFNELVLQPRRLVSALGASFRNENVRRVELAWGAAIAAEWAHFVALGVFAYEQGGTTAVGVAGLVRLLPAAAVAPFAASLGDRFRREGFLLVLTLIGAGALAASAAAASANNRVLVFAFASVVGLAVTLIRPALQALLPSLARTPEELIASNGATSTIESLGTLVGPVVA